MSWSKNIDIHCDEPGCGSWDGQSNGKAPRETHHGGVRRVLRRDHGWGGVGQRDVCPSCVEREAAAICRPPIAVNPNGGGA